MFAGQELAAGRVVGQLAQNDGQGFHARAGVFQDQLEAFHPGLAGAEPAAQAGEQAAQAEEQHVHLVGGGRQGEAGAVAFRWDEARAGIRCPAIGPVKTVGEGLGVAAGEPVAGQVAERSEPLQPQAGEEFQDVGAGSRGIVQDGQGKRVERCLIVGETADARGKALACLPAGGEGGRRCTEPAGVAEFGETVEQGFSEAWETAEQAQAAAHFQEDGARWVQAEGAGKAASPGGDLFERSLLEIGIPFGKSEAGG